MARKRVLIMGAAGKDFHVFNCLYRGNAGVEVKAFTATQIPDISGRKYPRELAGDLYPDGVSIYPETDLLRLMRDMAIEEVVFAYSDVSHSTIMDKAALVGAEGAAFVLPGAADLLVPSRVPVVSICAIRTGCGKSQTARKAARILQSFGKRVIVIRHPMPYGDLRKQAVQRFAELSDMDRHQCTIEEMEEYEPHVTAGIVVMAGVDYHAILKEAEKEADVILWDGGNNDIPFYRSDLEIVVVDPHRAGHELTYYPGSVNFRRARVIVINKMDTAAADGLSRVEDNIRRYNPEAVVIRAASPVTIESHESLKGKTVLVVEDGPTLTHGEMTFGAGIVAARKVGVGQTVDPRPYLVGSLKKTFEQYAHIGPLLPAMGYSSIQVKELEETINRCPCDAVLIATPINLARLVRINKPAYRVTYALDELGKPDLEQVLRRFA